MNRLILDNTGGMPFNADTLQFMQNSYDMFNALGELAGNLAILKGCTVTGTNVSDGVVYINGEIYYFKGGTKAENVSIRENTTSAIFKDGVSKPVKVERYAEFGGVGNVFRWEDFKRIPSIPEIQKEAFGNENSLLKRLEKLEKRVKNTIPIGLVAIWDKPADRIPEGWVEHDELQGYTPVGFRARDRFFGTLGGTLGKAEHKLTVQEIPAHRHKTFRIGSGSGWGSGQGPYAVSIINHGGRENYNITGTNNEPDGYLTDEIGGNMEHNNIQPSRIVRFIRFVGFD